MPEVIDLAKAAAAVLPEAFVFVGGHSASFIARDLLDHADGAIDCVLKGECEASVVPLLEAAASGDRRDLLEVPGVIAPEGSGPPAGLRQEPRRPGGRPRPVAASPQVFHRRARPVRLDRVQPGLPLGLLVLQRLDLLRPQLPDQGPRRGRRRAEADQASPASSSSTTSPSSRPSTAWPSARRSRARGIKKQYYLETRGDVLLRNKEVFRFWKTLGLQYMFLGVEAIDEEGLKRHRKRVSVSKNFEALEFARSLGVMVAINIIADPDWDRRQFEVIRQWCLEIPEIVNISVNTPYPGTESWLTEARRLTTRDYRLFDIQHAVLPTRLPLAEFYQELVSTQQVLNRKHLGWQAVKSLSGILAGNLARGQTNTLKMLWKFNSVYDPRLQMADHQQPVRYELSPPPEPQGRDRCQVDLHPPGQWPSKPGARRSDPVVRQPDADESRARGSDGRMSNRSREAPSYVCLGSEELIGFISAAEVPGSEARLDKDPCCQVAALSDLAVGGDFPIDRKLGESGPQLVDRDVHGAWNVAAREFIGRADVHQEWADLPAENRGSRRHRSGDARRGASQPPRSRPC